MKLLCWLLCASVIFISACRKKREAVPSAPAPVPSGQSDAAATAAPPLSAPVPGATPAAPQISNQHFNQLSEALLKFRRDKNRGPANWQELITTGYLKQMPTAPPGKQYVFDRSLNVQMVPAR